MIAASHEDEDDSGFPLPILAEDEAGDRASRELMDALLIGRVKEIPAPRLTRLLAGVRDSD